MWAKAASALAKYSEGVLSTLDAQGYPLSVRQGALHYDGATGTLPLSIPASLDAVEGPANLLCHYHNEKLWGMHMIALKGRIERQGNAWQFVTTAFEPPSAWKQMRGIPRSANAYLAKRNLPRPVVDFAAIERLWQRVAKLGTR